MHFLENAIFLENGPMFLENGLARFFASERDRDWAPQWANMCPKLLFCSNIVTGCTLRFIQLNYNSVSRGQSTIIQEFQVIIRSQSGGMRADGYSSSSCETDIKPAKYVEQRFGLWWVVWLHWRYWQWAEYESWISYSKPSRNEWLRRWWRQSESA